MCMCLWGVEGYVAKRNTDSVPERMRDSVMQQTRTAPYSTLFLDALVLDPSYLARIPFYEALNLVCPLIDVN